MPNKRKKNQYTNLHNFEIQKSEINCKAGSLDSVPKFMSTATTTIVSLIGVPAEFCVSYL